MKNASVRKNTKACGVCGKGGVKKRNCSWEEKP